MNDLEEYVGVEIPEHFPAEWAKGDDRPAQEPEQDLWRITFVRRGVRWTSSPAPLDRMQRHVSLWRARSKTIFRYTTKDGEIILFETTYRKLKKMEVIK